MGNLTSSESIICKELTKTIQQLTSAAACLICKELTKPIHQLTSAVACLICSEPTKPIQQLTSAVACLICKELTKLIQQLTSAVSRSIILVERIFLLLSLLVKLPIGIFWHLSVFLLLSTTPKATYVVRWSERHWSHLSHSQTQRDYSSRKRSVGKLWCVLPSASMIKIGFFWIFEREI